MKVWLSRERFPHYFLIENHFLRIVTVTKCNGKCDRKEAAVRCALLTLTWNFIDFLNISSYLSMEHISNFLSVH